MRMVRIFLVTALLSSLPALAEDGARVEAAPIHTARPVPEPPDLVPAPAAAPPPARPVHAARCGKSAPAMHKTRVKAAKTSGQ